jgi:hypothetical protein
MMSGAKCFFSHNLPVVLAEAFFRDFTALKNLNQSAAQKVAGELRHKGAARGPLYVV